MKLHLSATNWSLSTPSDYSDLSDAIKDVGTKTCGALAAINTSSVSVRYSVMEWRKTSRNDRATRDRRAALRFYSLQRVWVYQSTNYPAPSKGMIREFFKRPELQVKYHVAPTSRCDVV